MTINPWKIIKSKYLIKDQWLTLRSDHCLTPQNETVDPYYILETVDWVNVVPFDFSGQVLINHQYRHGNQKISYEIPCGMIDADDSSPLKAAQRELLEETGYVSDCLVDIGKLYANPARQNTTIYNYLALDIKYQQPPEFDASENIESGVEALADVMAMIDSGQFNHALHISSLFLAFNYLKRLKNKAEIQKYFSPDLIDKLI